MCGVGVFALPVAFQQAGLWTGVILTFLLGVVNAHSMMKLVKCSQFLCHQKALNEDTNKLDTIQPIRPVEKSRYDASDNAKNKREAVALKGIEEFEKGEAVEKRFTLNYGDMAHEAFATQQSKSLRRLAKPMKIAVNACIIGLQLGICSAFYIFVVDHAKEVLDVLFSTELSRDTLFFTILPFFILIATVRSLVVLSWIGLIGNVLVVSAILIILGQMLFMEHTPLSYLPGFTGIEAATLAAGSIVYAYAAQAVVLPLENKMRKPRDMLGVCGVISTSVIIISFLYNITGFLGYVTYGDSLKGSITLNLTNSPLDFSVKLMLLLMTYCGYLIQHYPIVEMLWPTVQNRFKNASDKAILAVDYALRYAVVVLSFGLAYVIPNFKDIVPFIGVTTGMMIALVFPPLLETVVFIEKWRNGSVVALETVYYAVRISFELIRNPFLNQYKYIMTSAEEEQLTGLRSSYAFINLTKAICGVGIFALPVAYLQSGLWAGIILTVVLAFVNWHNMVKLVVCSQYLSKKKLERSRREKSEHNKSSNQSATTESVTTNEPEKVYKSLESTTTELEKEHKTVKSTSTSESETSQSTRERRISLSFGDMAEEAFASKETKTLRDMAKPIKFVSNACILGLQVGICSAYYVFVAEHLQEGTKYIFSVYVSRNLSFLILLPFFILLTSVRNLTLLSWIGLAGNILLAIAIISIDVKMIFMPHIPLSQLPSFTSIEGATSAAGTLIYALVGHAVVLALENKMRKPKDMLGPCGVISGVVIMLSILYAFTAVLGFITYGDRLRGSITLNLTNSWFDFTIKMSLMLMTYCGYLIQHYPVVETLWPFAQAYFEKINKLLLNYALRYAVVLLSFALACLIPNLENIIPFVGVTCGMMITLIFPALIEAVAFSDQWRRKSFMTLFFKVAVDVLYIILGLVFMVVGLFSRLIETHE
ncbi:unnamed protein product [Cylicocyclus nassatus]|uniref:Amino acid transporter transmembrane domain-containing protein n=1 Tax=Cylicocyclus nassatus TaxID=53992 RepID=A0AA36HBB4_CYLNA|nr:unnamed protein product [Cylicocyclus nassatus]